MRILKYGVLALTPLLGAGPNAADTKTTPRAPAKTQARKGEKKSKDTGTN